MVLPVGFESSLFALIQTRCLLSSGHQYLPSRQRATLEIIQSTTSAHGLPRSTKRTLRLFWHMKKRLVGERRGYMCKRLEEREEWVYVHKFVRGD